MGILLIEILLNEYIVETFLVNFSKINSDDWFRLTWLILKYIRLYFKRRDILRQEKEKTSRSSDISYSCVRNIPNWKQNSSSKSSKIYTFILYMKINLIYVAYVINIKYTTYMYMLFVNLHQIYTCCNLNEFYIFLYIQGIPQ